MSYLHDREYLKSGDVVIVQSSHQVNVLVMDDMNYSKYRRGQAFRYCGGFYSRFPAHVTVPENDEWNVVVALPPGRSATFRAGISYLKS